MDIQAIASQVAEAIKDVPSKAQDLVSDPKGTIESITGEKDFDVSEVLTAVMAKLKELGVDLSSIDLSKIDLSKIDVSKLDVDSLKDAAGSVMGDLGDKLGGLFGKK